MIVVIKLKPAGCKQLLNRVFRMSLGMFLIIVITIINKPATAA